MQLLPNCIAQVTPDMSKYGARAGLLFGIVGFAALAGPPIAGGKIQRFSLHPHLT